MLEILHARGVEFDVVEYLKAPLTRGEFERILDAIPNEPADLVRKDKKFGELELNADDYTTKASVIDLLLEHPVLMQRPIVFKGDAARICRPSDIVNELID